MARSSAQSDFVFTPGETMEPAEIEPPDRTSPIALPQAKVRTRFASTRLTRIVMGVTFFMLFVLTILTIVGPHIPSGE
ncbi:MAG: hypothetical protein KF773_12035 [Deltaproteobacteria bacterium]|nr:hypothetical protein [Deltaproteobacteria bacterium]MCW5803184.1 hypothetical protein [Deltaproteobacteria bacterium]